MFKDVLPEVNPEKKAAILLVMKMLPDKNADRSVIEEQALCHVQKEDVKSIKRLIKLSPQCYGTDRHRCYWRIVATALTREEAIQAYLSQFPNKITKRQREALVQYLLKTFRISTQEAERKLQCFSLRSNACNRESGRHSASLVCYA